MKERFLTIFLFLVLILAVIVEFSPILISFLTGNWWFMLLFLISWIPSLVLIGIGGFATVMIDV